MYIVHYAESVDVPVLHVHTCVQGSTCTLPTYMYTYLYMYEYMYSIIRRVGRRVRGALTAGASCIRNTHSEDAPNF